jgi:ketosteroid isomerase-like protein
VGVVAIDDIVATMDSNTVTEVTQVINRYVHIVDNRELDALPEIFASGAIVDQTQPNGQILEGLDAIREFFALGASPERPHYTPAHHATSIYVFERGGMVCATSKFLSIERTSGMVMSGDYHDEFVQEDGEWLIAKRTISIRWHPRELSQSM